MDQRNQERRQLRPRSEQTIAPARKRKVRARSEGSSSPRKISFKNSFLGNQRKSPDATKGDGRESSPTVTRRPKSSGYIPSSKENKSLSPVSSLLKKCNLSFPGKTKSSSLWNPIRTPLKIVQLTPVEEFKMEFGGQRDDHIRHEMVVLSPEQSDAHKEQQKAISRMCETVVDEIYPLDSDFLINDTDLKESNSEEANASTERDYPMQTTSVCVASDKIIEDSIELPTHNESSALKMNVEGTAFERQEDTVHEQTTLENPESCCESETEPLDFNSDDAQKETGARESPDVILKVEGQPSEGSSEVCINGDPSKNQDDQTSSKVTKLGRIVHPPQTFEISERSSSAASSIKSSLSSSSDNRTPTPDSESLHILKEKFESESSIDFCSGQLVWAKVGGGSPFWPGMIVYSEGEENIFSKVTPKGSSFVREYLVRFFGKENKVAWIRSNHMFEHTSLDDFHEKINILSREQNRKKKRHSAIEKSKKILFVPQGKSKLNWDSGVEEASDFLELSNEERLEKMRNLVLEKERAKAETPMPRKRRRESDEKDGGSQEENSDDKTQSAKKLKFSEADQLIQAIPAETLEKHRRKIKTGFKLFHLANYEKVKSSNDLGPDPSDREIDRHLNKLWTKLSAQERMFYQEKSTTLFSDEDGDSTEDSSNGRTTSVTPVDGESDEYILLDSEDEAFNDSASMSSARSSNSKRSSIVTKNESSQKEMIGVFKKESCCMICEEVVSNPPGDNLLKCKGSCQNSYHLGCLKKEEQVEDFENWQCEDCSTGDHSCLLCKSKGNGVQKCNTVGCGRFFHRDCLTSSGLWPQTVVTERSFTCPAHLCHTCASDNPKEPFMKYKTRLLRCIRCPTAYHTGDFCVAAGTVQVTASQIICPKHNHPPAKKNKNGSSYHVNVQWCFLCAKGGSLICCERCPASFHVQCLKLEEQPDGSFYCDNCEAGRMPLYGEVVWVKLGQYRWWPAKVLHPTELPANIERLPHSMGEFPIQFCGSHEYYWINHGRCFLYEEGDSDKVPSISGSSKSLTEAFQKGIREAAELHEAYTSARLEREEANASKMKFQNRVKRPTYTRIKTNRIYGECPIYADGNAAQVCDCKYDSKSPCGPDSECINRLLLTECKPNLCRAKERCLNQRFQKRLYPKLEVNRTHHRGWGLFAKETIKKGEFVIEYVGELITVEEYRRRLNESMAKKEESNFYYMTMDNNRMIDAGPKGNNARFMNHSCDPNCETQKWTVNGDTRVGLFATKDIPPGTELTFNYQFEAVGEVKKECLCRAKNCSGWIGEKPTRESQNSKNGSTLSMSIGKKKKTKVKKTKKLWEDLCFRCLDDGKLLMCDHKTCPKVYHLECVNHDKLPNGKWYCPWHHCVFCGKPAVGFCMHCPNAYCKEHNNIIRLHPEIGAICNEHEDDLEDTVVFYRKAGGISKLVPNPNVPLEDVLGLKTRNDNIETFSKIPNNEIKVETIEEDPLTLNSDEYIAVKKEKSRKSFPGTIGSLNRDVLGMSRSLSPEGTKDLQSSSSLPSSVQKKHLCKCIEIDCGWQGLKSQLVNHLLKSHRIASSSAHEKARSWEIINGMMKRNDRYEKTSLDTSSSKRGREILKVCPEITCQLSMRSSNLVRHCKVKHPHITLEDIRNAETRSEEEGNEIMRASIDNQPNLNLPARERMDTCHLCHTVIRASNLRRHLRNIHQIEDFNNVQGSPVLNESLLEPEVNITPTIETPKAATVFTSAGVAKIECPECALPCQPSNFSRHFSSKHPGVPMPETNFRKKSSVDSSMIPEEIAVEPVIYTNEDNGEIEDDFVLELSDDEGIIRSEKPSNTLFCGYLNCSFVSGSKEDLAQHRRVSGHPKPKAYEFEGSHFMDVSSQGEEDFSDDGEVITVQPDFQESLSVADEKAISARQEKPKKRRTSLHSYLAAANARKSSERAHPNLKYACDTPDCGYRSAYRQNLDRHCKRWGHFAEYLIRTSKKPNPEMLLLASQAQRQLQGDDFVLPSNDDSGPEMNDRAAEAVEVSCDPIQITPDLNDSPMESSSEIAEEEEEEVH